MIASQANLTLGKVLSLIFFNYGQGMLYFSLAGMAIVWSLFHLRGKSPLPVFRITLELFVILFGLLAMLSLFKKLLTDSPLRLLNVAATCVPVLVGAWFFKIDTGSRLWGRLARLVVTGLLVVTFILGIISSYGSPLTGSPNIEFTYAQQAGVSFGAKNTPTDGKNIYMMTDNNMLLSAAINYQDLIFMLTRNPQWRMQRAPAHFGQGADYLKLELHNPGSLWIMAYDYAFYTQVWPEGGRFTKEDFTTLDQDINWHKVYTSGDLEIWRHTHLIYNPPINSHGR